MAPADWQTAAHQVTTDLTTLWSRNHRYAQDSAAAAGQRTFDRSLFGLAAIVIVTAVTVLITVRVANRVIRRLKRLRAETLERVDPAAGRASQVIMPSRRPHHPDPPAPPIEG